MLDPNQFLDDLECESESSMKAERDCWLELYENCFDCIFTNLLYILQNHLDQFLELKHFNDPMVELNLEEEEFNQKVGKNATKSYIYQKYANDSEQEGVN